jgi:hypothetical protein
MPSMFDAKAVVMHVTRSGNKLFNGATASSVLYSDHDNAVTRTQSGGSIACMANVACSYNELAGLPRVGTAALSFGTTFVTDTTFPRLGEAQ